MHGAENVPEHPVLVIHGHREVHQQRALLPIEHHTARSPQHSCESVLAARLHAVVGEHTFECDVAARGVSDVFCVHTIVSASSRRRKKKIKSCIRMRVTAGEPRILERCTSTVSVMKEGGNKGVAPPYRLSALAVLHHVHGHVLQLVGEARGRRR